MILDHLCSKTCDATEGNFGVLESVLFVSSG